MALSLAQPWEEEEEEAAALFYFFIASLPISLESQVSSFSSCLAIKAVHSTSLCRRSGD